jgi:hypothetical protein
LDQQNGFGPGNTFAEVVGKTQSTADMNLPEKSATNI